MAVATSTESPQTAAATTGSPSTHGPVATTALPSEPSVPTRDPTAAPATSLPEPDAVTSLGTAAATDPPSTERPAAPALVSDRPTARPGTATLPSTAKGTELSPGTVPPCSLQIRSLPPHGTLGSALRIECRARCPGNVTVRWLRTPVGLGQYREEAAGSSSMLQLDRAEPWHQGRYQCVLHGRRSPVATLQLTVSDGEWWPQPSPPCPRCLLVSVPLGAGGFSHHVLLVPLQMHRTRALPSQWGQQCRCQD